MRLVNDGGGSKCPHCNAMLSIEASWECDGEPYPDQNIKCPMCKTLLHVSQHVVTELEEVK